MLLQNLTAKVEDVRAKQEVKIGFPTFFESEADFTEANWLEFVEKVLHADASRTVQVLKACSPLAHYSVVISNSSFVFPLTIQLLPFLSLLDVSEDDFMNSDRAFRFVWTEATLQVSTRILLGSHDLSYAWVVTFTFHRLSWRVVDISVRVEDILIPGTPDWCLQPAFFGLGAQPRILTRETLICLFRAFGMNLGIFYPDIILSSHSRTYANGDRYEGDVDENGLRHGKWCRYYHRDGHVLYSGHYERGMRHGAGAAMAMDGTLAVGSFVNGEFSSGYSLSPTGQWFCGSLVDRQPCGEVQILGLGWSYVGQYESGGRSGTGMQIWSNGDVYAGEWKDGVPLGRGSFAFRNGDVYAGDFQKGTAHGVGEYVSGMLSLLVVPLSICVFTAAAHCGRVQGNFLSGKLNLA